MGEVIYSINGKYFKDRKVYVSDSEGLFDALKRKKINTYDWAEYHGQSVDLSNPKYEAREITLKCFVVGDNWVDMKENHDAIVSEFQKSGTQRLLIEPFGMKPLPYEVYMEDSSPLNKTFKDGQMVGVFTIKLIEPNPIKKVLYLTENTLNLSYNSSKETEIFFVNGEKTTAKGNVSLSGKTLANRVLSGYAFGGRNLILNSTNDDTILLYGVTATYENIVDNQLPSKQYFKFTNVVRTVGNYVFYIPTSNNPNKFIQSLDGKKINISFYIRSNNSQKLVFENEINKIFMIDNTWKKVRFNTVIDDSNLLFLLEGSGLTSFDISSVKIEFGDVATDWTPAPEDEKYIIIAGDIDGITNLTTNATVLWEKL